jgi:RNA polymerase sigma-70 factor (ECF subfamily)
MGTLQTSSTLNRVPLGAPQQFTGVQTRKPRRIELNASARLNPPKAPVERAFDEDSIAVQLAIAGRRQAREDLFAPYSGRLYGTAFAILRNKEDAEDAVQDGLFRAYRKLRSFQGRSSFFTWLTRITINAALMARRKRNSHPEPSLDECLNGQPEWFEQVADARLSPERIYSEIETNAFIDQQLRQLSPEMQAAFRLRVQNGFSIKESCRVLATAPSTFKSRVSRARQKMASALRQSHGSRRRLQK